ncbi:MAG TPA: hypothetical protein VK390_03745, partial [Propionibacteriaceae bacterium]|nr:hypothetical protein [Propionibacteriaceae bacterium]
VGGYPRPGDLPALDVFVLLMWRAGRGRCRRPRPRPATASAPCGQGTSNHPGGVRGLGRERYVLVEATPDEIAGRIDLPTTAMTLHRSLLAGVELAYVTREVAADHSGLAAPARVIAMRAQGEAEVAIEQGETRFEE